jgi:hypothetical protein
LKRIGLWLRNLDGPGLVLGIHGPPGNGKTSLAHQGLSQAMGRPIFKIDRGGIGDASILGRSVWMGSEPGKITQALMSLGTTRLIIPLDEVDRVSRRDVKMSSATWPTRAAIRNSKTVFLPGPHWICLRRPSYVPSMTTRDWTQP